MSQVHCFNKCIEGDCSMYRILIIDDEKMERDGLCRLLNKFEIPLLILTQNNGREALEFLKKNPVDIVCTDIKMPFMDGLELCSEIRKLYPEIYLIVLSAYGEFNYAKQAIHIKVDEYLLKPISPKEFYNVIRSILARLDARDEKQEAELDTTGVSISNNCLKTKNKLVLDTMEIIAQNYITDLSLDFLASQLNITKNYLCHIFKKETGISIIQYITQLRINHAKHLLLHTSLKISEIAESVGYQDSSYFAMQFKNLCGVTPLQFRNGEME